MTFNLEIKKDLQEFLTSQAVEVLNPRKQMVEFKSVPVGAGFTKPCTNLLMWNNADWRLFVDDDLDYTGDDPRTAAMLRGPCRKRWQPLKVEGPLTGDVNDVLLSALELLDSPLRGMLDTLVGTQAREVIDPDETDFDLRPEWYGELFDVQQFDGSELELTQSQQRAVQRATQALMRQGSPSCPILYGPSGSGKSMTARYAAGELVAGGFVQDVFVVSGASMHAGVTHEADRDERLTESFAVAAAGHKPLIIFEQIDLLLVSSKLVRSLMSELIDRGIRLIGVTQPEFDPDRLRKSGSLARRLKMIGVDGADAAEMFGVMAKRMENWSLSNGVEVLPETAAAAVAISLRAGMVEPAGTMGLLESALIDARERGLQIVSPDEVYHVADFGEG